MPESPSEFLAARESPSDFLAAQQPVSAMLPTPQEAVDVATRNAQALADMVAHPPGVPMPQAPHELRGYTDAELNAPGNYINSRTGQRNTVRGDLQRFPVFDAPVDGAQGIARGVEQAAQPGMRNKAAGGAQVVEGAMKVAEPLMVATGVTAPLETALALGGGAAVQKGTEAGLNKLGVPQEYSRLAGDVAGLAGGGAAAKLGRFARGGAALPAEAPVESPAEFLEARDAAPVESPADFLATRDAATAERVEVVKPGSPGGSENQGPGGSAPLTPPRAAEAEVVKPGREIDPLAGTVATIPTSEVHADPVRFQFKSDVGEGGAGEELRSVTKFDPEKSGILSVWNDPQDGKTYVANGHNRLALAKRTGAPDVTVRYLDAADAQEARTKGALINIAEGRGDSLDAAKVFRDSGLDQEALQREGVSLQGEKAKEGLALANLDPHLFSQVVSGDLSKARGAVIGGGVESPEDQRALVDLLDQREKNGKRLTNDQVGEMIRLTNDAPKTTETQENLFGTEELTRSLMPEKAEVSDYVQRRMGQERKLFAAVGSDSAAEKLGAAGNVIKAGDNAKAAERTGQAQALYQKFSTMAGPVSDALDTAAARIAKGDNSTSVKEAAYEQIKRDLVQQASRLTGDQTTRLTGESRAPVERPQVDAPGGAGEAGAGERDLAPAPEAAPGAANDTKPVDDFSGPEYKGPVREAPLSRVSAAQSTTMGSGLGAFEPYLRDAFAEMKDLKGKRDAALAELERTKGNPGDQAFGKRVIEAFTGERDLWSARVNQAVDKLRRIVPDPKDQEALSLMRESAGRPGDLESWLDGTNPKLQEMDPADRAVAQKNIERLRPAMERALNPTDAMKAADTVLTKIAGETLHEGQRLGFLESRWTPEQYVPHILHPKGEGEVAAPAADRLGRALGGKIGKYFAFAETRGYPTLMEAVADNVRPKTLNALDAFTIHGDKFGTARATHLLVNQIKDSGVGIVEADRSLRPKGWVELAQHSPEFRTPQQFTGADGEPALVHVPLVVPKFIDDALRPITDPDYLGALPGFRKLRVFQAYTKAIQLGLSMFHATTENYMALWNMGPKGWVRGLRADRTSPEFQAQEREFISHGGTTAVQGKTVEAYKSYEPGSIPTWSDIWRRAPAVREMDMAAQKLTDFTFGKLQRQFKVTDYALHKAAWMAKHPGAGEEEAAPAMASMAKEINAVYGGLHWENMGVNKASVELARALMLAPDWTFSNVFNVKYAFERSAGGSLARKFWIRQLVGGMAATQLLSLAISKKPSKNPTQVYMGQDPSGKDIYQNVFFKGVAGDVLNLVHNVSDYGAVQGLARTMTGKAAPVVRAGLQLATNRDFLGREIVPKGMNPIAGTARAAIEAGKSLAPVPLSVSNIHSMLLGPKAEQYSVPEFLTTLFAGNPPRHVAPAKAGRPSQSIWKQIETGDVNEAPHRRRAGR